MSDLYIPSISIGFMFVSLAFSLILPIVLYIVFRKKYNGDFVPFLIGMAVMVVFAFVLEALLHRIVLYSPIGETVRNNVLLYGLYGGVAAALFEECGRYFAFSRLMKKYMANDGNALIYGVGHGGIECFVVLGMTMISNIVMAMMINNGNGEAMLQGLEGENLASAQGLIMTLVNTAPFQFLAGTFERAAAMILQLSMSVLVFFAVKKHKDSYLLYSLLIHFLADFLTVLLADRSLILAEAAVFTIAILAALFAKKVWDEEHTPFISEEE